VSRYQKGKTNLDFPEARDSEWQWHQLGYMQVCTPLQTDNHASTPPLSFLQVRCPSCRPTNSIKALTAAAHDIHSVICECLGSSNEHSPNTSGGGIHPLLHSKPTNVVKVTIQFAG